MTGEEPFYEHPATLVDEHGIELDAQFTPGGICLSVGDGARVAFHFSPMQAEALGWSLIRWAQRSRVQSELVRNGYVIRQEAG
jgi:hypothetical protein